MPRWHLWLSAAAIAVFAFLVWQDAMARVAWQRYGRANVALLLVRHDAALAMLIGNYHFGGRSYDLATAERAYQKALRAKPGILWGHYQLARIHFVRGEYEQALGEINAELVANPENLRSLYVRGLVYGYRNFPGDLALAEADFRRFTLWAPKEWAGYNDLAWILATQGKHREALAAMQSAFREIPDAAVNPWLWNSVGVARLNLGDYEEARAAFEQAGQLASRLTSDGWRKAYPGNEPSQAESGLAAFRAAITENLMRARTAPR